MATDERIERPPFQVDPEASPFEVPPVEGLPLTELEREHLRRVIDDLEHERAAEPSSVSPHAS